MIVRMVEHSAYILTMDSEFKEHPHSLCCATIDKIKEVMKNEKNRCFTIIGYEHDDNVLMMVDTICKKMLRELLLHGAFRQQFGVPAILTPWNSMCKHDT